MTNSIQVIHPYEYHGAIVFDDEGKQLFREPFVAGADSIIRDMAFDLGLEIGECDILFSDSPFPGNQLGLLRLGEEEGGYWYCNIDDPREMGWLCPATLKYFSEHPKKLYIMMRNSR